MCAKGSKKTKKEEEEREYCHCYVLCNAGRADGSESPLPEKRTDERAKVTWRLASVLSVSRLHESPCPLVWPPVP